MKSPVGLFHDDRRIPVIHQTGKYTKRIGRPCYVAFDGRWLRKGIQIAENGQLNTLVIIVIILRNVADRVVYRITLAQLVAGPEC